MNIINHIKRWNKWRKHYLPGHKLHKLLVLLHIKYSPTFEFTLTDEDEKAFKKAFIRGFTDGYNSIKSKNKI